MNLQESRGMPESLEGLLRIMKELLAPLRIFQGFFQVCQKNLKETYRIVKNP